KVKLCGSFIESSAYHAPNQLRKPSSVGFGTTWNMLAVACRNVVILAKLATPNRRDAVFSLSCNFWNHAPTLIWCIPFPICKPSVNVNRFLRFRAPAALLGPAEVMAAAAVVVVVPPMIIPPGPCLVTKERFDGYVAKANESKANPAREKPA